MIYFILAPELGRIKIGFAKQPWSRLSKLQTDCPCDVRLVAFIDGDVVAEKALHARFADQRLRGEWFTYSGAVQEYIQSLEPAPAKTKYQSRLQPICDAAGIGRSYASAIVTGKTIPPVSLMLHLFSEIGWRHPHLQGDENILRELADKIPYRRKGKARAA